MSATKRHLAIVCVLGFSLVASIVAASAEVRCPPSNQMIRGSGCTGEVTMFPATQIKACRGEIIYRHPPLSGEKADSNFLPTPIGAIVAEDTSYRLLQIRFGRRGRYENKNWVDTYWAQIAAVEDDKPIGWLRRHIVYWFGNCPF